MKVVVFSKQFKFSPNGYDVVVYQPSDEPVEVSDECAAIAQKCGCLKAAKNK